MVSAKIKIFLDTDREKHCFSRKLLTRYAVCTIRYVSRMVRYACCTIRYVSPNVRYVFHTIRFLHDTIRFLYAIRFPYGLCGFYTICIQFLTIDDYNLKKQEHLIHINFKVFKIITSLNK